MVKWAPNLIWVVSAAFISDLSDFNSMPKGGYFRFDLRLRDVTAHHK